MPAAAEAPSDDRLDSWKEIAAHLKRSVSTVQRWEQLEGLPVRRHPHGKLGSVYASRAEVDAWREATKVVLSRPNDAAEGEQEQEAPTVVHDRQARNPELAVGGGGVPRRGGD